MQKRVLYSIAEGSINFSKLVPKDNKEVKNSETTIPRGVVLRKYITQRKLEPKAVHDADGTSSSPPKDDVCVIATILLLDPSQAHNHR